MVEFEKVNDYKYIVTDGKNEIDRYIRETIENISCGQTNIYNDTITNKLYETMLSRYVSALFLKKHKELMDTIHHTIITITINNMNFNITLGNFGKEEDLGFLNGITKL